MTVAMLFPCIFNVVWGTGCIGVLLSCPRICSILTTEGLLKPMSTESQQPELSPFCIKDKLFWDCICHCTWLLLRSLFTLFTNYSCKKKHPFSLPLLKIWISELKHYHLGAVVSSCSETLAENGVCGDVKWNKRNYTSIVVFEKKIIWLILNNVPVVNNDVMQKQQWNTIENVWNMMLSRQEMKCPSDQPRHVGRFSAQPAEISLQFECDHIYSKGEQDLNSSLVTCVLCPEPND